MGITIGPEETARLHKRISENEQFEVEESFLCRVGIAD